MADVTEKPVITFKKRENRSIRKRAREEDEEPEHVALGNKPEDEEPEDNRPLSEKLADARLAQQLRQRKAGLDHTKLALGVRDEDEIPDEEVNLGTGLNDAFEVRGKQQQNYGLQERGREEEEDPHLREFLERQMAQKRARELGAGKERDPFARGPGEAGVPGDAREMKNLEEMLYQIPEHLRGMEKRDLNSEAAGWLTGIQEVKLDKKFKMKNVEDTEVAKKRLLEAASEAAAGDDDEERLPRMHTRIWMMPRQFGRGAQYKGQSDTAVARRFKDKAFTKDR